MFGRWVIDCLLLVESKFGQEHAKADRFGVEKFAQLRSGQKIRAPEIALEFLLPEVGVVDSGERLFPEGDLLTPHALGADNAAPNCKLRVQALLFQSRHHGKRAGETLRGDHAERARARWR